MRNKRIRNASLFGIHRIILLRKCGKIIQFFVPKLQAFDKRFLLDENSKKKNSKFFFSSLYKITLFIYPLLLHLKICTFSASRFVQLRTLILANSNLPPSSSFSIFCTHRINYEPFIQRLLKSSKLAVLRRRTVRLYAFEPFPFLRNVYFSFV